MIDYVLEKFYETVAYIIEMLPDVPSLELPSGANEALQTMFKITGYFMPYSLYAPLLSFILALTAFRIILAIYMRFKKN